MIKIKYINYINFFIVFMTIILTLWLSNSINLNFNSSKYLIMWIGISFLIIWIKREWDNWFSNIALVIVCSSQFTLTVILISSILCTPINSKQQQFIEVYRNKYFYDTKIEQINNKFYVEGNPLLGFKNNICNIDYLVSPIKINFKF